MKIKRYSLATSLEKAKLSVVIFTTKEEAECEQKKQGGVITEHEIEVTSAEMDSVTISFMENELMSNATLNGEFLSDDVAKDIALRAYDYYCQVTNRTDGSSTEGYTQYEAIEAALEDYAGENGFKEWGI